jgi:hypothetical protein
VTPSSRNSSQPRIGSTSTQSAPRATATRPFRWIAWIAPGRSVRTTSERGARRSGSGSVSSSCPDGTDSTTRRPALATAAVTATGRSAWVKRLMYSSSNSRLAAAAKPTAVTPMLGTSFFASTWRSSQYEKVSVPVACWTTSTPTVTTKPSRPTIAPTSTVSTPLAVDGE